MRSGYYQVEVAEEDKEKAAFALDLLGFSSLSGSCLVSAMRPLSFRA